MQLELALLCGVEDYFKNNVVAKLILFDTRVIVGNLVSWYIARTLCWVSIQYCCHY